MRVAADQVEILARASRAREMLRSCSLCELRCGVDRTDPDSWQQAGPPLCGLGAGTFSLKRHVSYAEELDLLPSYMVYLGGCNFRCRFCVQAPGCFDPGGGHRVVPEAAAGDFGRVVSRGARTINLLGGEPSMHLHTILEIAAAAESPLPIVLNSNMYMTPEVIELLDGVVTLYLADFKFGNDMCAERIAGVRRYVGVVTRNLLLASGRSRVIVRHLLMPGHVECCLRPVASWMAEHLPEAEITLMTGYLPAWRAVGMPGLSGCLSEAERTEADRVIDELGLRRAAQ
jgi:putative pyruvate formate lyase activating enzyme